MIVRLVLQDSKHASFKLLVSLILVLFHSISEIPNQVVCISFVHLFAAFDKVVKVFPIYLMAMRWVHQIYLRFLMWPGSLPVFSEEPLLSYAANL